MPPADKFVSSITAFEIVAKRAGSRVAVRPVIIKDIRDQYVGIWLQAGEMRTASSRRNS